MIISLSNKVFPTPGRQHIYQFYLVASRSWESQCHLERIINKPLEGSQCSLDQVSTYLLEIIFDGWKSRNRTVWGVQRNWRVFKLSNPHINVLPRQNSLSSTMRLRYRGICAYNHNNTSRQSIPQA